MIVSRIHFTFDCIALAERQIHGGRATLDRVEAIVSRAIYPDEANALEKYQVRACGNIEHGKSHNVDRDISSAVTIIHLLRSEAPLSFQKISAGPKPRSLVFPLTCLTLVDVLQQTVSAFLALVDDVDFPRLRVLEHKEGMSHQLHLHDGLHGVHRVNGDLLHLFNGRCAGVG